MKRLPVFLRNWLLSFMVCAVVVAVTFAHMDVPIALHFWRVGRSLSLLNTVFGTAVILAVEAAVALGLILARVVRGHISRFGETLAIACLASICTYGVNSEVLKPFFGVPGPAAVMQGARHSFNFLQGSGNSSFPSGHMVLAGAFAGVFISLYKVSTRPFGAGDTRRGTVGCRQLAFSQRCDRRGICRCIRRDSGREGLDRSLQAASVVTPR